MTISTVLPILFALLSGSLELAAAYIAFRGLRRLTRRVPELRAPQNQILEALAMTGEGVNLLLLDRVVRAVLEDWSATRSSRIAVTTLVPLGIVLATAGDVMGAWT
jgi:hypothetical protein